MSERKRTGGLGSMFLPPGMRMAMGDDVSPGLDRALLYTGIGAGVFIIGVFAYALLSTL